jgi:predicted O-linked N-acetylglucosamine transferase (SPINDLY family)
VLTCLGQAFAGRVAASLLHAVGFPELVTSSLDEYLQRAVELASSPARLAEIRQRLARNRETAPLFDTKRFCRNIEAAYTTMWERQQQGLPPQSFAV